MEQGTSEKVVESKPLNCTCFSAARTLSYKCSLSQILKSGPATRSGYPAAVRIGAGYSRCSSKRRGRVRRAAGNVRQLKALAGSFVPQTRPPGRGGWGRGEEGGRGQRRRAVRARAESGARTPGAADRSPRWVQDGASGALPDPRSPLRPACGPSLPPPGLGPDPSPGPGLGAGPAGLCEPARGPHPG